MQQGEGGIKRTAKIIPGSSGPPFPLNSADNGCSVDTVSRRIVLGQRVGQAGNPAQLLNNREIPLMGFTLDLRGNLINESIDDTLAVYQVTEALGNPGLFIDWTNRDFALGDFFAAHNGINLELNDLIQRVFLGDSNGINNATFIKIDDAVQTFEVFMGIASQQLELDPTNDTYWVGDVPGTFNTTFLYMDTRSFEIDCGSDQIISADKIVGRYLFGDIPGFKNGLHLHIDDNAGQFIINNTAHNAVVVMNGVSGFTGTVTPVASITVNGGIVTNVT
jgi:hypothetical protein